MRLAPSIRHLAILALGLGAILWVALLWEFALPVRESVHHDFLAFYAAGRLILTGDPGGLYDEAAVASIQRTIIPTPVGVNGYMPFINPPFAAVAFAPFAALSPGLSRAAWAILNVAVLVAAGATIARPVAGRERLLTIALVAAAFPVYHALAESQWSILLLAAGLVALAAVRRDRWWLVGLALVPFWLKPQFLVLPLVALALARRWRAIAAVAVGGIALVAVSLPFTGIGPYVDYVGYLTAVVTSHFSGAGATHVTTWQGDIATMEGLNGLLVGYLGQEAVALVNGLWAAGSIALVGLYALALRRQPAGASTLRARAMLATGIAVTLLVNPNLYAQDCVLVFLVLASLWPLPARWALPAVVVTVAFTDLILLDQAAVTVHLFTLGLVAAVVLVCWRILGHRWPSALASPAAG